jgi:hypothetical protein
MGMDGQFNNTFSVVVDSAGNVFVADHPGWLAEESVKLTAGGIKGQRVGQKKKARHGKVGGSGMWER